MGVCGTENERKIRQRRLTNKKTFSEFNGKSKLNKSVSQKKSKKFDEFKIQEINCDNFYNINNNYNYSIIENTSNNQKNNKNDESIDGLNLMNQPIENLTRKNNNSINEIIDNEKYNKLLGYYKLSVEQFPYKRLSPFQIIEYENEYISSKMITPYKFIETKNNSKIFTKIYELCFLKSEPLLNNISDDKKAINLLFLKTVIILLNENYLDKALEDISNLIIQLSYDSNNFIKKDNFYQKIKNFCEICYQVIFYFIVAYNQFTEEQYYEYLNNQNMLMQNKYTNIDIDIFCLNTLFNNLQGADKLDEITSQWSEFVFEKINDLEGDIIINEENDLSNIKKRIIWMVNPYHLLQILAEIKFPKI